MVLFVRRRSRMLDRAIRRRTYSSGARKRRLSDRGGGRDRSASAATRVFVATAAANVRCCDVCSERHLYPNARGPLERVYRKFRRRRATCKQKRNDQYFCPCWRAPRIGTRIHGHAPRGGGQTKYIMCPCRAINGKFLSNFLGPLPPIDAIFAVASYHRFIAPFRLLKGQQSISATRRSLCTP